MFSLMKSLYIGFVSHLLYNTLYTADQFCHFWHILPHFCYFFSVGCQSRSPWCFALWISLNPQFSHSFSCGLQTKISLHIAYVPFFIYKRFIHVLLRPDCIFLSQAHSQFSWESEMISNIRQLRTALYLRQIS